MTTCRCLLALLLLTLLTVLLGDASKPPFRGELSAVPRGRDELLGKSSPRSKKPGGAGNGFVTRLFPGKHVIIACQQHDQAVLLFVSSVDLKDSSTLSPVSTSRVFPKQASCCHHPAAQRLWMSIDMTLNDGNATLTLSNVL